MSSESKKNFIIALLLIALAYSVFGQNGFGQGRDDKAITKRLDTLETNQRNITAQLIRDAEETARNLRRIEAAEERASRIEGLTRETLEELRARDSLLTEARELAERSERTLRAILEGTESKDQNP